MKQKNSNSPVSVAMVIISTGFAVAIGAGHPISDNGLELICVVLPILITAMARRSN
jgi:hypothetical protein